MNDQEFNLGFENEESNTENLKKKETSPSKKSKKQSKNNQPDFEKSLQRLESIVDEMERGDLSLEKSMKHFEEGSKLADFCTAKLEETEKKIEILLKDKTGENKWVPCPSESDDEKDSINF